MEVAGRLFEGRLLRELGGRLVSPYEVLGGLLCEDLEGGPRSEDDANDRLPSPCDGRCLGIGCVGLTGVSAGRSTVRSLVESSVVDLAVDEPQPIAGL